MLRRHLLLWSISLAGVATAHLLPPVGAIPATAATSLRLGGLVRAIDSVHKSFIIYSTVQARRYTIEVAASTHMTLSKWTALFTDVHVGDHLTVTGDFASTVAGSPIVARTIRVGSPTFAGRLVAVAPAPGGVALSIMGSHQHLLKVTVGAAAVVVIDQDRALVADLMPGESVSAHGTRQDKYWLTASSIHVRPHHHTVSGTVLAAAAGTPMTFTLLRPSTGARYIVRTTLHTTYSTGGVTQGSKAARIALSTLGTVVHVRGYDIPSLHGSLPVLAASHVSIIVSHSKKSTAKTARTTEH